MIDVQKLTDMAVLIKRQETEISELKFIIKYRGKTSDTMRKHDAEVVRNTLQHISFGVEKALEVLDFADNLEKSK